MIEWLVAITAIAVGVVLAGPRLVGLVMGWYIKRQARNTTIDNNDPLLAQLSASRPAIIYFTADWCGPCRTMQTPAIERLQADMGDAVHILKIDADAQPEIAKRWQVLSLPRTFIFNSRHQLYTINLEAVNAAQLREQLTAAEQMPTGAALQINTEASS